MFHPFGGRLKNSPRPIRQLWMNAVMDPQALTPVRHQSELVKLRQMSGDVRLRSTDGVGELADAELFVLRKQHQATQPCLVGQCGE